MHGTVAVAVGAGVMRTVVDGVAVKVGVAEIVGVAVIVAVAVAVAVGVAPTIPCPESSTCCGLFLAESVNVRPFFFVTFPVMVGWNTTSTLHELPAASGAPEQPSV
jgi:hypothetical protein